jgi:outer membrane receptor protein involved in Fe transport
LPLLVLRSFAGASVAGAQDIRIEGVVRDTSGVAVPAAQVELHAKSYSRTMSTGLAVALAFDHVPETSGTLFVIAKGLQEAQRAWSTASGIPVHLDMVLGPLPVNQHVIVTAARTETRLSDSPLSYMQLTREDVQPTPALMLDDVLRQIPGFSSFRRSSSRTANPATQGVSL